MNDQPSSRMNRYGKHNITVVLDGMTNVATLPMRCIFCTSLLFKFNNRVVYVIVDDLGVNWKDLKPGETRKEHKCRGCNTIYNVYTSLEIEPQEDFDRDLQRSRV